MAGPHAESEAEVVGKHDHPNPTGRLTITVVTPKGAAASGVFDEIVAPGALGEFDVLPGHIPFLATLRGGVLSIKHDQRKESLAVGPGYLQVGAGDTVRVLVESALSAQQIDLENAQHDLDSALAAMKSGVGEGAELDDVRARLEWAQARLAVGRS